jgi:hypothetical protein
LLVLFVFFLCAERNQKVRAKFLELISSKTLLVGHSLDNDLRCLRVVHLRVGDTSLLFPHSRGPPLKRSLRELASTYLQLNDFQAGEHCSVRSKRFCRSFFCVLRKNNADSRRFRRDAFVFAQAAKGSAFWCPETRFSELV